MNFENQDRAEFGHEDNVSLQSNAAPSPIPDARGLARILTADGNNVVVLPPGLQLDDVRIEGRDLVIVGEDGARYVIPDGAIFVPQLVIDGVSVPPLNLAALLVGNEPQPAAGNPQSSGGNFAGAVDPLQGAYGLGDLLPYTELQFPADEDEEIIPDIVDREPVVVIVTPDQPAGATAATASVDEAGLPARGSEPPGTAATTAAETTSGTIVFAAPDGLASVTINGVVVTAVGQTFAGANGTLTITSIAGDSIGYSYTLDDNLLGQTLGDSFVVAVTEADGDTATATLDVSVIDDAPVATDDFDDVAAGTYGPETGNVVTGSGTRGGAAGADIQGADGATVSAISGAGGSDSALEGGVYSVAGQYGTLTIAPNGSYSYVRNPGTPGGVSDSFTYTLTDGDGSQDTAVLTIAIADSPVAIISVPTSGAGTVVDEAGLPARPGEAPGTQDGTDVESTSGTITFSAPDGPATVQINGTVITGAGQQIQTPEGTLTITAFDPSAGTIDYTFVLADNTGGDDISVTFTVTVTDVDGDSDTEPLTITILDDAPLAVDDSAAQSSENAAITVEVLANDIQGADSVQPGTVTLVPGTLSGAGQLVNNGDGTFTYTPGPAEEGTVTFDYSIADGDGDTSTATVTITLLADSEPTVTVAGDNDVLEAGLGARGNEPAGSLAAGDGEFAVGTIAATTGNDTLATLVVNGADVTGGGVVVTAKGMLTVTPDGNGGYGYSYELTDNTLSDPDSDSFSVTVTDSDGSTASTTLVVAIVDDSPTAADDAGSVPAGQYGPIGGNVVANDTQGADGAVVTAYSGTGGGGAAGDVVQGQYGTLTIAADGTFSYTRDAGTPGGVSDTFSYTITDGDGDPASAQLVISIADSGSSVDAPDTGEAGTRVLESALSFGSDPNSTAESTSGTITFSAPDGPAILTIDGQPVAVGATFAGAFGTLTVDSIGDGTIGYTYLLTTNTSGDATFDGFVVRVEDQDGDFSEDTLTVDIVDDVPTARPDTDSVTEDGPLIAQGNVITDAEANGDSGADTPGADGAAVVAYSGTGGSGAAGDVIQGTYGTLTIAADGGYTYTLDNTHPLVQGLDPTESLSDSFAYTIRDGDGDESSSALVITIDGADDGVTIAGLNAQGAELSFDEDDLGNGSSPDATQLTKSGTFTVDSPDGLASVSVGGVAIYTGGAFVPGQSIATAYGTLTFTGVTADTTDASGDVTAATVSFTYTLNDNTLTHTGVDDAALTDSYDVLVTDTDGTVASDTLEIDVIDDVPAAVGDSAGQATENEPFTIDALANDTFGADEVDTGDASSVFVSTQATQGTVTYDPGTGLFTYTPAPGAGATSTSDSFAYTIVDGDGDSSTATVTVTLQPDSTPTGGAVTATVDDDGLAAGNPASIDDDLDANQDDDPADTGEASFTGTLTFDVLNDTPATIAFDAALDGSTATVGLETVEYSVVGSLLTATVSGGARDGTELFTVELLDAASGDYRVTLRANVLHAGGPNDEATDAAVSIGFTVTDSDLSGTTTSLTIVFDDDAPTASDDTNSVDEGGSTGGNVFSDGADDAFGADEPGGLLSFTDGVATGAPGDTIETSLGFLTINADGSYTYQSKPNSTQADTQDSFTYTIIDADGDTATATLVIDVVATVGNVSDNDVTVDESGLDNGAFTGSQIVPDGEFDTDGQISVTGGTPPYTYVLTGANSDGDGAFGTLVLDATTGAYSYTLDTPFTDAVNENSRNTVNGAEGFTYEVYDALNNLLGSGTISVNIVDDVPDAVDDSARQVAEDGAEIGGNVLTNDTPGADGASLTHVDLGGGFVAITTGTDLGGGVYQFSTALGDYTFDAAGNWTFDPDLGLTNPADASFDYRLTDGDGDFDSATQPITVDDGNGPGAAGAVALTVNEAALDTDATGDLAAGVATGSQPGLTSETAASDAMNQITFTAGSDDITSVVFADPAGITIDAGLEPGTMVTWVLSDGGRTLTGSIGGQAAIVLQLSGSQSAAAGGGTVVPTVTVSLTDAFPHQDNPDADQLAISNIGVTASEADGDSATGLVAVTVLDDAPDAEDDGTYAVAEDTPLTITDALSNDLFGADDVDVTNVDPVSGVAVTANPAKGTVAYNDDGTFTYTPNAGAEGADSFKYTITDGDGDTATATVTLTIAADSTPSVSVTDGTVDEQGLPAGTGEMADADAGNDSDPSETTTGTFTIATGNDALGAVEVQDKDGNWIDVTAATVGTPILVTGQFGTLTVTSDGAGNYSWSYTLTTNLDHPVAGAEGAADPLAGDSFAVRVTDDEGDMTTPDAASTIDITVLDDAPDAEDDNARQLDEDGAAIGGNVLANDTAGADEGLVLTHIDIGAGFVALDSGVDLGAGLFQHSNAVGTYTFDAAGNWTFDPDLGLTNPADASFDYRVEDGDGDTDEATQPISVNDGNGPAVAGAVALTVNEAALDTDATGDLAAGAVTGSQPGLTSETGASGAGNQLTFTAGSDDIASVVFANPDDIAIDAGLEPGTTVTWVLSDGGRTLTGSIGGQAAIIVQLSGSQSATAGGGAVTPSVTVTLTDAFPHEDNPDADQLAISGITVRASEADTDDFIDGFVSVTVLDDAPDADPDTDSVTEDGPLVAQGNVVTDAEANGDDGADIPGADGANVVAYSGTGGNGVPGDVIQGAYGTLTIAANGGYTYTLDNTDPDVQALGSTESLSDSFDYTIRDGDGDEASSTLIITINGANDAPTVVAASAAVSDEGFPDGLQDTAGNPTDQSDSTQFLTGDLQIADTDANDALTVTLAEPAQTIRIADNSTGTALTWAVLDGGHRLVGYVTDEADPSIEVILQDDGTYTVEIFDPIYHPDQTSEDVVSFVIPVEVSDGTSSTPSTITVELEDDSPEIDSVDNSMATVPNDVGVYADIADVDFGYGGDGAGTLALAGGTAITGLRYAYNADGSVTAFNTQGTADEADDVAYFKASIDQADGTVDVELFTERPTITQTNPINIANTAPGNYATITVDGATFDGGSYPAGSDGPEDFVNDGSTINVSGNGFGIANNLVKEDKGFLFEFDNATGLNFNLNFQPNTDQVTIEYAAFDDGGQVFTGSITVDRDVTDDISPVHIEGPNGEQFDQLILFFDFLGGNNNGARVQDFSVEETVTIFPDNQIISFDVVVTDADGDSETLADGVQITFQGEQPMMPPIALDLDGDGVEFVGLGAGVTFDYDGDGLAEATAWTATDDGILAIDLDGDGAITSGREIVFGGDGLTDLQGLAANYDTNKNGLLDASDSAFAQFGVLQDSKFISLSDAGIASIGLTSDGVSYTAAGGQVVVRGSGSYTGADGSTGVLADAAFAFEARSVQRTGEILTTAAIAGALIDSSFVAAAPSAPATAALTSMAVVSSELLQSLPEFALDDGASASSIMQWPVGFTSPAPGVQLSPQAASYEDGDFRLTAAPEVHEYGREAGGSSEFVADFAGPALPQLQLDAGSGALMDMLLSLEAPPANLAQVQESGRVQEALSDLAAENMVEAIVDHFAGGMVSGPLFAANDVGPSVLAEALDGHVFAGMGISMPDVIEQTEIAAATQA